MKALAERLLILVFALASAVCLGFIACDEHAHHTRCADDECEPRNIMDWEFAVTP